MKETYFYKFKIVILYFISLLPLLLPWFGFDREIDGLRSGIEVVNSIILVVLVIMMMMTTLFQCKFQIIVLLLHDIVYMGYFLFWYVPLITNFNIITSFETAHVGFYLTVALNILLILFIKKH